MKKLVPVLVLVIFCASLVYAAPYKETVTFGNGKLYAKNPGGNWYSLQVYGQATRTLTINTSNGSVHLSNVGSIHISSGTIEVKFVDANGNTTWGPNSY